MQKYAVSQRRDLMRDHWMCCAGQRVWPSRRLWSYERSSPFE